MASVSGGKAIRELTLSLLQMYELPKDAYNIPEKVAVYDFQKIFVVPAGLALLAALILLLFFHPPKRSSPDLGPAAAGH